jgi:hypothetical protein
VLTAKIFSFQLGVSLKNLRRFLGFKSKGEISSGKVSAQREKDGLFRAVIRKQFKTKAQPLSRDDINRKLKKLLAKFEKDFEKINRLLVPNQTN